MPRLIEMGTLQARCKRRADLENDTHIDDAEWLEIIDEAFGELHSLVSDAASRFFETTSTLVSDGTAYVAEPTNHQSTLGLWYVPATGAPRRLRQIDPVEYEKLANRTGAYAKRYELIDDRVYLYPTPPTSQNYLIRYVPQAPDISTYASDVCVDVFCSDGLAYVIWGAVVKAKAKQSKDATLAIVERDRMAEKVRDWAINRSLTEPRRMIVDHEIDEIPYADGEFD